VLNAKTSYALTVEGIAGNVFIRPKINYWPHNNHNNNSITILKDFIIISLMRKSLPSKHQVSLRKEMKNFRTNKRGTTKL
jgi:hypothetical protein